MKGRANKENPDVIWSYYTMPFDQSPSTKMLSREELIRHIEDSISSYQDDRLFYDKPERLYFYLDRDDLTCTYIGYDEAVNEVPNYIRIPFTELLSDTIFVDDGEPDWDERKIRKFVREHVSPKLLRRK